MAKKPPKRYGTPGQAGTPRTSKSNRGQAAPMPKKRVPYATPGGGGNYLGDSHRPGKGVPTSGELVKRPVRRKRAS